MPDSIRKKHGAEPMNCRAVSRSVWSNSNLKAKSPRSLQWCSEESSLCQWDYSPS